MAGRLAGTALTSEVDRTNNVILDRMAGGQDITSQIAHYKNLTGKEFDTKGAQRMAMERMLQNQSESMYKNQEALLQQQRNQQTTDLNKAYTDALSQSQIATRDAENAFNDNKSAIEKQAYLDSESTKLAASNRGIGNSQQMLGMMASDQSRTNGLINQNMSERDRRIADITDRINAITKQRDLDLANVNNQYNLGLQGARSKADEMRFGKMFDFNSQDYFMGKQQDFEMDKMSKQQEYELEQMAQSFGYDMKKMSQEQIYQLARMAQQYKNELGLQDNAQAHDRDMADIQFGNQKALNDQEHKLQVSRMKEQMELENQQKLKEYDLAVTRELAKYKPGTSEYKIRESQLADERKALLTEMAASTQFDAISKSILNGQTTKPVKPTKKFWQTESSYKKDLAEYEQQLKSYQRYLEYMENPLGAFPNLGSLSSKYESNGNPAVIANNKGDLGGKSYGTYQLTTSSGNAQRFADSYGGALKGKKAGTAEFDKAWKLEASKNPEKFKNAQHAYIAKTHFQPALNVFQKVTGIVTGGLPKAIQDVIWSVGVQHGKAGAQSVFEKSGVKAGDSPATIIRKIYDVRPQFFKSSPDSIQQSVARRFKQEEQDALRMLG